MDILPLTYDKYFKKAFSNLTIAKKFLEDFLDIEIAEISHLETDFNLTNKSRELRFDFRCKGDDKHFIVEMQQWYKPDVVKRFYLYHCTNTALQLENLPKTKRHIYDKETKSYVLKEIKDYSKLTPSITIIWFVDDSFRYKEDYLVFTILPEKTKDFILDESWEKLTNFDKGQLQKLYKKRNVLKKLINKKNRDLDFLQKNKMIYIFQKQVLRNKKNKKYFDWFDFANKSKNKENKNSDFSNYQKKGVFKELMRILSSKFVSEEELNEAKNYCDNYEAYVEQTNNFIKKNYNEIRSEFLEEAKERETIIAIKEEIIKENKEKLKENKEKLKEKDLKLENLKKEKYNEMLSIAKFMKKSGIDIEEISKSTKISIEEIKKI